MEDRCPEFLKRSAKPTALEVLLDGHHAGMRKWHTRTGRERPISAVAATRDIHDPSQCILGSSITPYRWMKTLACGWLSRGFYQRAQEPARSEACVAQKQRRRTAIGHRLVWRAAVTL